VDNVKTDVRNLAMKLLDVSAQKGMHSMNGMNASQESGQMQQGLQQVASYNNATGSLQQL
jgi:hypothetical protein